MKKLIGFVILNLTLAGVGLAQKVVPDKKPSVKKTENMSKIRERKPFEYDNEPVADANGVLKRGAGIGTAKKLCWRMF